MSRRVMPCTVVDAAVAKTMHVEANRCVTGNAKEHTYAFFFHLFLARRANAQCDTYARTNDRELCNAQCVVENFSAKTARECILRRSEGQGTLAQCARMHSMGLKKRYLGLSRT